MTTRQQGELEPLDTYLTELTNNFRRLHITDAEKMRYFVQGHRSEIRKAVLIESALIVLVPLIILLFLKLYYSFCKQLIPTRVKNMIRQS